MAVVTPVAMYRCVHLGSFFLLLLSLLLVALKLEFQASNGLLSVLYISSDCALTLWGSESWVEWCNAHIVLLFRRSQVVSISNLVKQVLKSVWTLILVQAQSNLCHILWFCTSYHVNIELACDLAIIFWILILFVAFDFYLPAWPHLNNSFLQLFAVPLEFLEVAR